MVVGKAFHLPLPEAERWVWGRNIRRGCSKNPPGIRESPGINKKREREATVSKPKPSKQAHIQVGAHRYVPKLWFRGKYRPDPNIEFDEAAKQRIRDSIRNIKHKLREDGQ